MRIALGVEYDGQEFCGWQSQKSDLPTVQGVLEAGLSIVADSPIKVICAGRTDAGVHACGQVVHFDTDVDRSERSWVAGANANIANSISVVWAKPVSDDFHARFSSTERRYLFRLLARLAPPTHDAGFVWHVRYDLSLASMQEAAHHLIGQHDFTTFRSVMISCW